MEAEQIENFGKWPELKFVQDIQVFLGFANFYCWFIKSFSMIATPLILITIMSLQVLIANEMLGARMLAANELVNIGSGGDGLSDGLKYVEPKTRRSESQKWIKSLKLFKSGNLKGKISAKSKKPSKSENSPNFDAKKAGPSFLTLEAKSAFNRLPLAFIEAPIYQHFNPKCHIWIKTDALGYAIGGVLSQLASGTRPEIKRNRKLEAKFLGLFWVLHPVGKQAYKLKFSKKWRIHDVFHISLLKQDTTKKGQVNDAQVDFEFEAGNNKEYEVNGIQDSAIYTKKSTTGQLLGLYYLVSWKGYLEE